MWWLAQAVAGVVIGVSAFTAAIGYLCSESEEERKRKAEVKKEAEEQAAADLAKRRLDLAVTCERRNGMTCGALALPIPATGNRYRCEKCGRQFAQARHGM